MNVLEELRAEKAKPLREIYEECREEDIYNQGYMMDMLDDDQSVDLR